MVPKTDLDSRMLNHLNNIFHYIVVILIGILMFVIGKTFYEVISTILVTESSVIINEILFILILVELFTILYFYLREHRIKVERIVELGIIAIVREVMFHAFEIDVHRIYAVTAFLLALGAIFYIEKRHCESREKI